MDFYSVIMDFFWVSVILFVAKIIREHVKILQNFFIPVSLIAGFIAWVVGPYGLKIVPLTSLCGDYAGALITVLFATIGLQGLGIKKGEGKKRAKDIAGYCVYRQINWAVQFSVPMILSILLLSRLHTGGDLHPAFGWLIPVSFLGGTGPAIAAGQVLDKYGFSDFTGLGITAAAYGMLLGLIGGIIMTKLATKRDIHLISRIQIRSAGSSLPELSPRASAAPLVRRRSPPLRWSPWRGTWPLS